MSAESFAILRKNAGGDISKLAEEHFKHDLRDSDRDTLNSAANKIGTHATVGSLVGLGLGLFLAFRIRSARTQMFNAFRTSEKPTHVKFPDGREGMASPLFAFLTHSHYSTRPSRCLYQWHHVSCMREVYTHGLYTFHMSLLSRLEQKPFQTSLPF